MTLAHVHGYLRYCKCNSALPPPVSCCPFKAFLLFPAPAYAETHLCGKGTLQSIMHYCGGEDGNRAEVFLHEYKVLNNE